PFLTSAVIATSTLAATNDTKILPQLAEGSKAVLVLPWSARAEHWSVPSQPSVAPVAGALDADFFILPVHVNDELRLHAYGSATIEPLTSLDVSRQLAAVAVSGQGDLLARADDARKAVDAGLEAGASLLASEQVGI